LYVGLGDKEAVDLRCALRRCVLCSGLGFRRCLVLEPEILEALCTATLPTLAGPPWQKVLLSFNLSPIAPTASRSSELRARD
jgi:hypothetical protein